jgi:photosystem II stability/assembly factor-like uncharacterized protein
MMLRRLLLLTLLTTATIASAQWQLQDAHTTADLRGIDNVGGGVAWASGSDGTILRTEDAGFVWQLCAKPPGGEHLDFRAIQAFDNNTAIIMSSGKGDLSRLYKTTDGCQTWDLVFENPDPDGFWDAMIVRSKLPGKSPATTSMTGDILGDPVRGKLMLYDFASGRDWLVGTYTKKVPPRIDEWRNRPRARPGEAAFAASNSAFFRGNCFRWIVTGGTSGARILKHDFHPTHLDLDVDKFTSTDIPLGNQTASSGAFSLSFRPETDVKGNLACETAGLAVGGDYLKPTDPTATAAFTADGGKTWTAATTPPHGYRSAVAYDSTTKTWITVGPNGTDISTDDGRNWRPLHPDPKFNDTPDADQHWNALSLPYAVGPHGRIGTLRPSALTSAK